MTTRCALYLRPVGVAATPHFDERVKSWLRDQGYEPVDGGCFEAVVCLPYDGGGGVYGRDVSIAMANRILEHLAIAGEFRWIHLRGTAVNWTDGILSEVLLEFEDNGYAPNPTLVILTESEAADTDRRIREERRFTYRDLGVRWHP